MTVPAPPVFPPDPPMRGRYSEELVERLTGAIDEAARREFMGGGQYQDPQPGPLEEELAKVNIRLVDTTRESAAVDLKVYSAKVEELAHWRGKFGLLDEWVVMQFGKRGQPIEDGDLFYEGWQPTPEPPPPPPDVDYPRGGRTLSLVGMPSISTIALKALKEYYALPWWKRWWLEWKP